MFRPSKITGQEWGFRCLNCHLNASFPKNYVIIRSISRICIRNYCPISFTFILIESSSIHCVMNPCPILLLLRLCLRIYFLTENEDYLHDIGVMSLEKETKYANTRSVYSI